MGCHSFSERYDELLSYCWRWRCLEKVGWGFSPILSFDVVDVNFKMSNMNRHLRAIDEAAVDALFLKKCYTVGHSDSGKVSCGWCWRYTHILAWLMQRLPRLTV